jgi:hypothetical protein
MSVSERSGRIQEKAPRIARILEVTDGPVGRSDSISTTTPSQ